MNFGLSEADLAEATLREVNDQLLPQVYVPS